MDSLLTSFGLLSFIMPAFKVVGGGICFRLGRKAVRPSVVRPLTPIWHDAISLHYGGEVSVKLGTNIHRI